MKRCLMLFGLLLFVLTGCFQTRQDLFTVPLITGRFSMDDSEAVSILNHEITRFDIVFNQTGETTDQLDGYVANQFGDYAYQDVVLFDVVLTIGLDGVDETYETQFIGAANPQRPNAYRLLISMPALSAPSVYIVLDLHDAQNDEGLTVMHIQMQAHRSVSSNPQDASFYVYKTPNE